MKNICPNCEHEAEQTLINEIHSKDAEIATSDGGTMPDADLTRMICHRCACTSVIYSPKDRLNCFFSNEYSIDDTVQNNTIYIDGVQLFKHAHISKNLFKVIEKKSNIKVLEVACGHGDLLLALAKRFPSWKFVGLDPNPHSRLKQNDQGIEFIEGFLQSANLSGTKFDLVIAHGLLNRLSPHACLKKISDSCQMGSIVSIEVVLLENSNYAPLIWDHPYTYTESLFAKYLNIYGFELRQSVNCGSSNLFIAEKTKDINLDFEISKEEIDRSIKIQKDYLAEWNTKKNNFNEVYEANSKKIALFGAGLYSRVLLTLVDPKKLTYVIDERRKCKEFRGIPVVSLQDADPKELLVALCVRPSYQQAIEKRLKAKGFELSLL